MRLANGVRLGPYGVLGPLGAGGTGEVYRARDHRLDQESSPLLAEGVAGVEARAARAR